MDVIHIEVAFNLDASLFLNAFHRFISWRGPVQKIASDNEANFVGGDRQLREAIKEWEQACRRIFETKANAEQKVAELRIGGYRKKYA